MWYVLDGRYGEKGRSQSVWLVKHFTLKSVIGKTPQKLVRPVFNEIGNVSSLSSVYRIFEFELKYKKRLLLRCIHHFKSDLIYNLDHMRISGTEPSSVILSQNTVI